MGFVKGTGLCVAACPGVQAAEPSEIEAEEMETLNPPPPELDFPVCSGSLCAGGRTGCRGGPEELSSPSLPPSPSLCATDLASDHRLPGP